MLTRMVGGLHLAALWFFESQGCDGGRLAVPGCMNIARGAWQLSCAVRAPGRVWLLLSSTRWPPFDLLLSALKCL